MPGRALSSLLVLVAACGGRAHAGRADRARRAAAPPARLVDLDGPVELGRHLVAGDEPGSCVAVAPWPIADDVYLDAARGLRDLFAAPSEEAVRRVFAPDHVAGTDRVYVVQGFVPPPPID